MHQTSVTAAVALLILSTACGDPDCPPGSMRSDEGRCIASDTGIGTDAADTSMDTSMPPDTSVPCTPTGSADVPDIERIDDDCDGVDGVIGESVFVALTGDDANEGTTPDVAVRTLGRGLEVAATLGRPLVLVSVGLYAEQIVLEDGVSIYGGYDADAGWSRPGPGPTLRAASPVVLGTDLTDVALVELTIEAEDAAPGESSVAMRLVGSTGVVLEAVTAVTGAGGAGDDGPVVTTVPLRGNDGTRGGNGVLSGASCGAALGTTPLVGLAGNVAGACSCARGGNGGTAGTYYEAATGIASTATKGQDGAWPDARPTCPSNTAGAGGGWGTTSSRDGRDGTSDTPGTDGMPGTAGATQGVFSVSGYEIADGGDGTDGTSGFGGAGGGGGLGCIVSSFCHVSGGAGGGGGSGGCGGEGGSGGAGGGAAVALWLWASAVSAERSTFTSGPGGDGGQGSAGASGGAGGTGLAGGNGRTLGACVSGRGGRGGNGGTGGEGGGGGGGGGGPSAAVLLGMGSTLDADGTTTSTAGAAGRGGGGGGSGPAGMAGVASDTLSP